MNEVESLLKSLCECWNVRMFLEGRVRELEAKIKELQGAGEPGEPGRDLAGVRTGDA